MIGRAERERREGDDEKRFPEQGDRKIQSADLLFCAATSGDQPIGRQAHQGESQIETNDVAREENADIAEKGQQPAGGEPAVLQFLSHRGDCISSRGDPEQGACAEEKSARRIENENSREQHLVQD